MLIKIWIYQYKRRKIVKFNINIKSLSNNWKTNPIKHKNKIVDSVIKTNNFLIKFKCWAIKSKIVKNCKKYSYNLYNKEK